MTKTKIGGRNRSETNSSNRRGRENPSQTRMEPVGEWVADVKLQSHGRERPEMRRKVRTLATKRFNMADMGKLISALRGGNEVRLTDADGNDAIRLYPCLDANYSEMFVAAQTIGDFRKCLDDIRFKMTHCGDDTDGDEARAVKSERKEKIAKRIAVTPDTIVTCNVCGNEIRVGKYLSDVK